MLKKRIVARIDVKNEFVIKGIQLEGLRKVGDPYLLACRYYSEGIDEIVFMDSVASLYGRNNLFNIIDAACRDVFVPITVGGGIRSLGDIELALKSGADKVAINTQAIKTPDFITVAAKTFGSQCIVASIEAKRSGNAWEAYMDCGRERSGMDAVVWAKQLETLGAGEILVTSVDMEGTRKGFDTNLIKQISDLVSVPVVASGGAGSSAHVAALFNAGGAEAVAIASLFHYNTCSVVALKRQLAELGMMVRL